MGLSYENSFKPFCAHNPSKPHRNTKPGPLKPQNPYLFSTAPRCQLWERVTIPAFLHVQQTGMECAGLRGMKRTHKIEWKLSSGKAVGVTGKADGVTSKAVGLASFF